MRNQPFLADFVRFMAENTGFRAQIVDGRPTKMRPKGLILSQKSRKMRPKGLILAQIELKIVDFGAFMPEIERFLAAMHQQICRKNSSFWPKKADFEAIFP